MKSEPTEPNDGILRTVTQFFPMTESSGPRKDACGGPDFVPLKSRHVYRFDPPRWTVGFLDAEGRFSPVSLHDSPEAAAIAATRLNGHDPETDPTLNL
jgi:hypothetical protein